MCLCCFAFKDSMSFCLKSFHLQTTLLKNSHLEYFLISLSIQLPLDTNIHYIHIHRHTHTLHTGSANTHDTHTIYLHTQYPHTHCAHTINTNTQKHTLLRTDMHTQQIFSAYYWVTCGKYIFTGLDHIFYVFDQMTS